MLNYHMPLFRPPSEGKNSLIFQVTLGCSFNKCSFCSMYRTKEFQVRPLQTLLAEIQQVAQKYPWVEKVFLADGDALYCDTHHLITILNTLYEKFPQLQRVTTYALPNNLRRKSLAELEQLQKAGLSMIYYGIESGSDDILKRITKGATQNIMAEGIQKASAAGLKISATVILGLGGTELWQEHIDGTIDLVNQVELNFLSTLQLGIDPNLEEEFYSKWEKKGGTFKLQNDVGLLQEQVRLVQGVAPSKPVTFRSNHASNALPLAGDLPNDRDSLVALLEGANQGQIPLVPHHLRGY